jgi:hypothetical protein
MCLNCNEETLSRLRPSTSRSEAEANDSSFVNETNRSRALTNLYIYVGELDWSMLLLHASRWYLIVLIINKLFNLKLSPQAVKIISIRKIEIPLRNQIFSQKKLTKSNYFSSKKDLRDIKARE